MRKYIGIVSVVSVFTSMIGYADTNEIYLENSFSAPIHLYAESISLSRNQETHKIEMDVAPGQRVSDTLPDGPYRISINYNNNLVGGCKYLTSSGVFDAKIEPSCNDPMIPYCHRY